MSIRIAIGEDGVVGQAFNRIVEFEESELRRHLERLLAGGQRGREMEDAGDRVEAPLYRCRIVQDDLDVVLVLQAW